MGIKKISGMKRLNCNPNSVVQNLLCTITLTAELGFAARKADRSKRSSAEPNVTIIIASYISSFISGSKILTEHQ